MYILQIKWEKSRKTIVNIDNSKNENMEGLKIGIKGWIPFSWLPRTNLSTLSNISFISRDSSIAFEKSKADLQKWHDQRDGKWIMNREIINTDLKNTDELECLKYWQTGQILKRVDSANFPLQFEKSYFLTVILGKGGFLKVLWNSEVHRFLEMLHTRREPSKLTEEKFP